MTSYDFTPLYRSTVGFDHLASLLDSLSSTDRNQNSWPPYNIESIAEDKYRITMAVAGFNDAEIELLTENNTLTVSAEKADRDSDRKYLYRGIAERNFKRQFRLENHVRVKGASLENGLLHINLERELPEAMKPRRISINTGSDASNSTDSKLLRSA